MRIATWNLARPAASGRRTSALLAHMGAVQADVWVLTETHMELAPHVGLELVASSNAAPDLEPGEAWTAIWARRGVIAGQVRSADPERTACMKTTDVSGRPLYINGTVLPWLGDGRRRSLEGADPFAAALAEQAADWRRIRAAEPDAGLVVAGDLNQDLLDSGHYYGSVARRRALRTTLTDVGLVCLTGGEQDPGADQLPRFTPVQ
jgi:hypothetical protein